MKNGGKIERGMIIFGEQLGVVKSSKSVTVAEETDAIKSISGLIKIGLIILLPFHRIIATF